MRPDDWAEFDAWEARDRTLLEAAAARRRRLEILMGLDYELDEPTASLVLERVYAGQLTIAGDVGYDRLPPDEEPA